VNSGDTVGFTGPKHGNQVSAMAVQGRTLVTASMDDSIKITNLDTKQWGPNIALGSTPNGVAVGKLDPGTSQEQQQHHHHHHSLFCFVLFCKSFVVVVITTLIYVADATVFVFCLCCFLSFLMKRISHNTRQFNTPHRITSHHNIHIFFQNLKMIK
jgi:hypothetical protein